MNLCVGCSVPNMRIDMTFIHPIASPGHAKEFEVDMRCNQTTDITFYEFVVSVIIYAHQIYALTGLLYIPQQAQVVLKHFEVQANYVDTTKA